MSDDASPSDLVFADPPGSMTHVMISSDAEGMEVDGHWVPFKSATPEPITEDLQRCLACEKMFLYLDDGLCEGCSTAFNILPSDVWTSDEWVPLGRRVIDSVSETD